jgi:hypothetical protein
MMETLQRRYLMTRKTNLIIFLAVVSSALAACGPSAIPYVTVNHPKAPGHISSDVALYYAVQPAPAGAQVIEHITQTERSTNCENATINALEKMQNAAKGKGGNALINLKAVWEGKNPTSNEQGFWCVESAAVAVFGPPGLSVYGVTWEGDIATVGGAAPEPAAGVTPTPPATDVTPTPPAGGGEAGGGAASGK